jgi:tRNA(Arg) A34 adenosine deaminase TadA
VKKLVSDKGLHYSNIAVITDLKNNVVLAASNINEKQEYNSNRPYFRSIHAEKNAVTKLKRRGLFRQGPYNLYSFRVRKGRVVKGGEPCCMCRKMLESLHDVFSKIYYY